MPIILEFLRKIFLKAFQIYQNYLCNRHEAFFFSIFFLDLLISLFLFMLHAEILIVVIQNFPLFHYLLLSLPCLSFTNFHCLISLIYCLVTIILSLLCINLFSSSTSATMPWSLRCHIPLHITTDFCPSRKTPSPVLTTMEVKSLLSKRAMARSRLRWRDVLIRWEMRRFRSMDRPSSWKKKELTLWFLSAPHHKQYFKVNICITLNNRWIFIISIKECWWSTFDKTQSTE